MAVAQSTSLSDGTEVQIIVADREFILRPADVPTLDQLLKQVKRGDRPPIERWRRPVGKEEW